MNVRAKNSKYLRILSQLFVFLVTVGLAAFGFGLLMFIWSMISMHSDAFILWGVWTIRIYITICLVLIIIGQIYYYKWNVRKYSVDVHCHRCGKKTKASLPDYGEVTCEIDPNAQYHQIKSAVESQIYRPKLHYVCSTCGHEEYICPYCHNEITATEHKCPHCGKRIFH